MKIPHHKFSSATSDSIRLAKRFPFKKRTAQQGVLLIDCLMYVSLFFVISGIAFTVFYSCWDNAKTFRHNSEDILSALKAGERWRADVRTATAPLRVEDSPTGQMLLIPQKIGEVDYRFSDEALWRRTSTNGEWVLLLAKVKSSLMDSDHRRQITAWRWDVELSVRRKGARVVPLFTFEAVPPS